MDIAISILTISPFKKLCSHVLKPMVLLAYNYRAMNIYVSGVPHWLSMCPSIVHMSTSFRPKPEDLSMDYLKIIVGIVQILLSSDMVIGLVSVLKLYYFLAPLQ